MKKLCVLPCYRASSVCTNHSNTESNGALVSQVGLNWSSPHSGPIFLWFDGKGVQSTLDIQEVSRFKNKRKRLLKNHRTKNSWFLWLSYEVPIPLSLLHNHKMLLYTFSRNMCISHDLTAHDTLQNPKIQKKHGGSIWKIPILNNSAGRGKSGMAGNGRWGRHKRKAFVFIKSVPKPLTPTYLIKLGFLLKDPNAY